MGQFDATFGTIISKIIPPILRQPKMLAWFRSLVIPIQQLHDFIFGSYQNGFVGSKWSAGTYTIGANVQYKDGAVYQCIVPTTINEPSQSTDWMLIQSNFIGAQERAQYNGQKLVLEYALNKWFDTTFKQPTSYSGGTYLPKSDIYIVNNANEIGSMWMAKDDTVGIPNAYMANDDLYNEFFMGNSYGVTEFHFTIMIPTAVWTALGADAPTRNGQIMDFANNYVIAGVTYNIVTY